MIWVLWVPTQQHASELEASASQLWPEAPLELRVGTSEDGGLAWDGETLRWEQHAERVNSAEAAVLLARSWLREDEHALGWVPPAPAPVAEAPVEVVELEVGDARPEARGWVGIGIGERVEIAGLPDAMRLQGGVGFPRWSMGLVASVPIPRTRPPDAVAAAAGPREELRYRVSGLGAALHAVALPWRGLTIAGAWTLQPVGIAGLGVRQSAWQAFQLTLPRVQPAGSQLQLGPEVGLGLQIGSPAIGFRLAAVHRSGLLDGFEHHLALATDLLIRM